MKKRAGCRRTLSLVCALAWMLGVPAAARSEAMEKVIRLPKPAVKGEVSVEEAIRSRRSVRSYAAKALTAEQISQLVWAAQGITDERRSLRAAPSAGALYPLEVYAVTGDGVFRYLPGQHALERTSDKDIRPALAAACLGQRFVGEAGLAIVICAVYERVTAKYGKRGVRYTDIEAGHAAQNVALQAEALGLGSVPVGAFDDDAVAKVLGLPADEKPLYIVPVGHKR